MRSLDVHVYVTKKAHVLVVDAYSIQLLNTTMAEINARREARRRRILENSENRLRKITGRINPDEIKGKYNQYVKQKCV